MYDVGHACGHADYEREYGDEDNQQVAQAEQTKSQISFVLIDIGESQKADDSW